MALADVLRNGIALANTLTASVQATCTLEPWTGQDVYGKPTYGAPVTFEAVVDLTRRQRFFDGRMVTVNATLTVLSPVAPNGAASRREPIDPRDRITLPDGTTGPIIEGPGAVYDPGMARPFINEIFIGEPGQR